MFVHHVRYTRSPRHARTTASWRVSRMSARTGRVLSGLDVGAARWAWVGLSIGSTLSVQEGSGRRRQLEPGAKAEDLLPSRGASVAPVPRSLTQGCA